MKVVLAPLKATPVVPVKLVPLIVTLIPTGPLVGVKLVIVGGLETVTVTGSDVHCPPRRSRATAVKVCEPLLALVVFHCTEYGAVVTSAPKLAPSSLNCAPPTVSKPTIVTLALAVIVPLTVDPGLGDVIETVRLPSRANAGSGCIQTQQKITNRNFAKARPKAVLLSALRYEFVAAADDPKEPP